MWHEQVRDNGMTSEKGDCAQAHYSLNDDGTLGVFNSEYLWENKTINTAKASAKCEGAKCKVYFTPTIGADYRVLSTDYTNYAVVYSCTEITSLLKLEMAWLLTRERTPSTEVI